MPGLPAGPLRHRVTLQSKGQAQNTFGEETQTFANVITVWALVETSAGREFIDRQRAGAQLTHQVTIRYRADVRPTWHVIWEGSVLEIDSIVFDPSKVWCKIMCRELVHA